MKLLGTLNYLELRWTRHTIVVHAPEDGRMARLLTNDNPRKSRRREDK